MRFVLRSTWTKAALWSVGAALIWGAGAPSSLAQVQSVVPPVYSPIDGRGVNVDTGQYNLSASEFAIGQPGAGGLVQGRSWIETGWRDHLAGTINSSGSTYTVSLGDASETFNLSGGVYTSNQQIGSTLTFASNIYTYTMADGSVALFNKTLNDASGTVTNFWTANEGLITSLTRPDGEVVTWSYNTASVSGYTARRPQSVSNNLFYMIHFTYADDSPANTTELNGVWLQRTKATGINRLTYACGLTASTCSDSSGANWPYVTYGGTIGSNETVTDRLGNQSKYAFSGGKVTSVYSPGSSSNPRVTMTYSSGKVDWIYIGGISSYGSYSYGSGTATYTSPVGGTEIIKFHTTNKWITERWADVSGNRKVVYTRDAYGRVTRTTNPDGDYVNVTYDGRGNVTQTTAAPTTGTSITTSASYPGSCSNAKTCNQPTTTTSANGQLTSYYYNSTHGGLTRVQLPASGSGTYGSIRSETNLTYVAFGGIYRVDSLNTCATAATCSGSADESVTTFYYGNNLLPTQVTNRSGDSSVSATTTTYYTPQGDIATVDGPLSGTSDTFYSYYDDMRRLRASVSPNPGSGHRVVKLTYNADSQVTTTEIGYVSSPSSWNSLTVRQKQTTTYDAWSALANSQLMAGWNGSALENYGLVQSAHDAALRADCTAVRMNPSEFTSPPSSACTKDTEGSYGPDRITKMGYNSYSDTTETRSGWNVASRLDLQRSVASSGVTDWVADGSGNKTGYEYDGFNRLTKTYFPHPTSTGSWNTSDYEQINYDSYGRVTSTRNRSGQTTSYGYDNLGHVTLINRPGSDPDVSFAYDLLGRVILKTSSHQEYYYYDALSRPTVMYQNGRPVYYQHDSAGRRTRMTWPDSFYVTYEYNVLGEVTAIRENGSTTLVSFAYDTSGRRTSLTRNTGSSTSYGYDKSSGLKDLDLNLSGSSNDVNNDFTYNPAGQIISKTVSNASYNYTQPAAYTDTYTPDGLNQYDAIPGATPTYDTRGNMTYDGTKTYTYDSANRMTTAGSTSLGYDPSGRLYSVGTTTILYDGADMIAEYSGSTVIRRYVHGPGIDEPLVRYDGSGTGTRIHLFADERGSVVANEGSSTTIFKYDEYGVPDSGQTSRFQYTGQVWLAEVGLYYYKARFYNPDIGRFMQTDPIGYGDGMNLYNYVGSDPVNMVDPWGLNERVVVTAQPWTGNPGILATINAGPAGSYGDGQAFEAMIAAEVERITVYGAYVDTYPPPSATIFVGRSGYFIRVQASDQGKAVCTSGLAVAGAVLGGIAGLGASAGCDYVTAGACLAANPGITSSGAALGAAAGGALGALLGMNVCSSATVRDTPLVSELVRPDSEGVEDGMNRCMRAAAAGGGAWASFCGSLPTGLENNVVGGGSAVAACLSKGSESQTSRENWCRNQFGN